MLEKRLAAGLGFIGWQFIERKRPPAMADAQGRPLARGRPCQGEAKLNPLGARGTGSVVLVVGEPQVRPPSNTIHPRSELIVGEII
jgi:hypothetical protein